MFCWYLPTMPSTMSPHPQAHPDLSFQKSKASQQIFIHLGQIFRHEKMMLRSRPTKMIKHGVLSFCCLGGKKTPIEQIRFAHLYSWHFFRVLHVFKVNLSKSMASPMQSLASSKGSLKALQKFRRSSRFQVKKVVPFDDPLSLSKKRTVGMVRNKSNTTYCWIRLAQAQVDRLLGNGTTSFSMLSSHHPTHPIYTRWKNSPLNISQNDR